MQTAARTAVTLLGCAAGLYGVRAVLIVSTAPHEILFFECHAWWQWQLAAFAGALCGAASYAYASRRVLLLVAVLAVLNFSVVRSLMDASLMARVWPGFWYK